MSPNDGPRAAPARPSCTLLLLLLSLLLLMLLLHFFWFTTDPVTAVA